MTLRTVLGALVLVVAFAAGVSAQESEISGGGGGGITAAPGSGTAGVIPAFVSGTSLEDSKMTTSGTNKGTWTLYDSTLVTGRSQIVIREGPGQGANAAIEVQRASDGRVGFSVSYGGAPQATTLTDFLRIAGDAVYLDSSLVRLGPSSTIVWHVGPGVFSAADTGLARSAAGILAVTDGSTGYGSLRIAIGTVGAPGIAFGADPDTGFYSDSAGRIWAVSDGVASVGLFAGGLYLPANEVLMYGSDAWLGSVGNDSPYLNSRTIQTSTVHNVLALRHETVNTATTGFGTGLLFQGENAAGTMHDMASIDAVYIAATDTAEEVDLKFYTMKAGAEDLAMTIGADFFGTGAKSLECPGDLYVYAAGGNLFLGGGSVEWEVASTALRPVTTNNNTIGTSSLLMKDAYISTSIQGTRERVLVDNTIQDFVQISSATTDRVTGGRVVYTVMASDATNHILQTETGEVPFLIVNENGTVTVTLGAAYGTAIDSAGGAALANTFASSVSGTNAMIRVTSDYDQATLTGTVTHNITYRVYIDSGTATVTPQ